MITHRLWSPVRADPEILARSGEQTACRRPLLRFHLEPKLSWLGRFRLRTGKRPRPSVRVTNRLGNTTAGTSIRSVGRGLNRPVDPAWSESGPRTGFPGGKQAVSAARLIDTRFRPGPPCAERSASTPAQMRPRGVQWTGRLRSVGSLIVPMRSLPTYFRFS